MLHVVVGATRNLLKAICAGPPNTDRLLRGEDKSSDTRAGEGPEACGNVLAAAVLRIENA
jgi:hypothetical protein